MVLVHGCARLQLRSWSCRCHQREHYSPGVGLCRFVNTRNVHCALGQYHHIVFIVLIY
jgi:hypothetical protein